MDSKITMSFDQGVIKQAKEFAKAHNISLSRLTEFLLRKITEKEYQNLEDLPVSDWVNRVAEGEATYKKRSRSSTKKEFNESRK